MKNKKKRKKRDDANEKKMKGGKERERERDIKIKGKICIIALADRAINLRWTLLLLGEMKSKQSRVYRHQERNEDQRH